MTTTKPIAEKKDMCLECKGKGEKPCSNPDHNFIMAISTAGGKSPSESQCPECGYTGISKCEECNGTGIKINTTPKPKAECKHNEIGQSYGFPMCLKCGTAWSSKDFIPTTPKPNGWEEIMHTYGEKYTKYANYQISDKEFEKANREILDLIHQAILSAEKETVKRCKTIIIDYFAGSGELWFPYLPNKKEEIMAVKGEIGDLLELLSKKRLSEAKEDERRTI